jgi:hypothetical protein
MCKVLWVCTTEQIKDQMRKGQNYFETDKKVYDFLNQFHYDWLGLTTKKKRCGTTKKDYMYFRITGLEESGDGETFYVKVAQGRCPECGFWNDENKDSFGKCTHPGKAVCGNTLFFVPTEVKDF